MDIKLAIRHDIPGHETLDRRITNVCSGVGMIKSDRSRAKEWVTTPAWLEDSLTYLAKLCDDFPDKPVWYRTSDRLSFRVNTLNGCDAHIDEENPLLGLRGIRRSLAFPQTLLREIEMIVRLRHKYHNLHMFFPFVHIPSQLVDAKRIAISAGYTGKFGMMAEIPSTLLCLGEFLDLGIDYVVVGVNDLVDLTYGLSRRDSSVAKLRREVPLSAVLKLIELGLKQKRPQVEYAVAGDITDSNLNAFSEAGFDTLLIPYNEIVSGALTLDNLRHVSKPLR
jgi:phosphoenolpyruvate-protein kinase (PTS system EI component)